MGFNHDYGGVYERPQTKNLKKTRVYISGPMTGLPDLNFQAFNAEATRLKNLGYDVINPAELCDSSMSWHECMRVDLSALLTCDVIDMIDGWQESSGAHLEMNIAHRVGIKIVFSGELER